MFTHRFVAAREILVQSVSADPSPFECVKHTIEKESKFTTPPIEGVIEVNVLPPRAEDSGGITLRDHVCAPTTVSWQWGC